MQMGGHHYLSLLPYTCSYLEHVSIEMLHVNISTYGHLKGRVEVLILDGLKKRSVYGYKCFKLCFNGSVHTKGMNISSTVNA